MTGNSNSNGGDNSNQNERFSHLIETLGLNLFQKIQKAKILVVGAGGIGCELLKNLILSGFINIEIIDLDTIDLSNLNRQFLFRKHHIGMSKSKIAREAVLKYNPSANIVAHHGDIKSQEFGPQYFKQFDLVMNALDNLSARRHVNRVCLSADVPLVESGTAGYLGQLTVIKKGDTECFECVPTEAPKQFAVCTIRSNPSAPIHCIVWAKMLFGRLFGVADDSNAVTDMDDNIVEGTEEQNNIVRDLQLAVEKDKGYGQWVYHKVFYTDIDRLARMKEMWKEKKPPQPRLLADIDQELDNNTAEHINTAQLKDQKVWGFKENVRVFLETLAQLKQRFEKDGALSWDKDDDMALNFVVSASNIRSHIFGITTKSKFDVKSMAGNIIPAIATTNAVIGGLIVMNAINIIDGRLKDCKSIFLIEQPSNKRMLLVSEIPKPNTACYVCQKNFITIKLNTNTVKVGQLIHDILKKHLAFSLPMLTVGNDLLYESGDEDLSKEEIRARDALEQKVLSSYRMGDNVILAVEDYLQDFKVSILINHVESFGTEEENKKKEHEKWFEIVGTATAAAPFQTQPIQSITTTATAYNAVTDIDDLEIIEPTPTTPTPTTTTTTTTTTTSGKKRKEIESAPGSEDSDGSKKQKYETIE
ncbi:hypothetical protein CYY_006033 [Polysphondylium violaceum]|uniref:SUMO-activating enzyme subunit n=1 Tax=Polysphondylium violaceum TaxID=133409 RepID=A0A8J4PTX7_9MYCE|nr:hypothetical protein CYY_006033 [Polysphondylium violaceum]